MALKTKHALSADEIERELDVIGECWKIMQPLDANARERVLGWLQYWAASERPRDHEGPF